jgi:FkbM family methyltransferase
MAATAMPEWIGLFRSFVLYWRPGRQRGLRALYRPFVAPGDLVFDIGAHLGDRSRAFATLGARVVALEPQPQLIPWLHRILGDDERITIRAEAVGRAPGRACLSISLRTPTVSTLAEGWPGTLAEADPGSRPVRWDQTKEVEVTTLDELIQEFGIPSFCKLDIEGYEAEALAGLTTPLAALSMEFVRGGFDVAVACIDRLEALAPYEYNALLGEGRTYRFKEWVSPAHIRDWLLTGADGVSSGDIYARRSATQSEAGPGRPV